MKAPKETRTYCPRCKQHKVMAVSLYKQGKARAGAIGSRRHEEDLKGYGGQKFPKLVRTAKTTKKMTLRLKCKDCGYILLRKGIRLRKLEIAA